MANCRRKRVQSLLTWDKELCLVHVTRHQTDADNMENRFLVEWGSWWSKRLRNFFWDIICFLHMSVRAVIKICNNKVGKVFLQFVWISLARWNDKCVNASRSCYYFWKQGSLSIKWLICNGWKHGLCPSTLEPNEKGWASYCPLVEGTISVQQAK